MRSSRAYLLTVDIESSHCALSGYQFSLHCKIRESSTTSLTSDHEVQLGLLISQPMVA